MVAKSLLLQGVTPDNHWAIVRHLLQIPNPERVVISVGFMNESGLVALESVLSPIAKHTTILTGIRNGITSVQGLRKSLEMGCTTYVVDTGSRSVLFHPKVYVSRNADEARLVVGSANLTYGGLNSNIEASLYMEIDLTDVDNDSLVGDLETKIDGMIDEYPKHVLHVADMGMVDNLFDSGRLVDESIRHAPTTPGLSSRRDLDTIPRMKLKTKSTARHRPKPFLRKVKNESTLQVPTTKGQSAPVRKTLDLVWRSKPLTRRPLTIPTGQNTNQTGSMGFGKGTWDNIDQRHYFRDEVFANLKWQFDTVARTRHKERAMARFQLVVRDVSYGVFSMQLSHDTRTNTRTYRQKNSTTQLHWGEARHIVAHEDLLDRTMYLYRDRGDQGLFVLEID